MTDRQQRPLRVWFEADTRGQGVHLSAALRARGWTASELRPARPDRPHAGNWRVMATTTPVPASSGDIERLESDMEGVAGWFPGCRFVGSEPV
jgi:hypothetical protein